MSRWHFCCAICYNLIVVVHPTLEDCALMMCGLCEISAVKGKIPREPPLLEPGWEPRVRESSPTS